MVAMGIPRPGIEVVTQVDRHEGDAGFDQSPGQQCLLAPEVIAKPLPRPLGFP